MSFRYCAEGTILGFHFSSTIRVSACKSWSTITARIRTQAQDAYCKKSKNRIKCFHDYLLVKAWYTAQIFPLPNESVRQLNTTISWYIRKVDIFRVPLSTPKEKEEGGTDLSLSDAEARNEDGKNNCGLDDEMEHTNAEQEPALQ